MKISKIGWLKQQEIFFVNNKDRREFFLDLVEYFETISNDRTLSGCLDEIRERQGASDQRHDLIIKHTEDKLLVLKDQIILLAGRSKAFSEIKKLTDKFNEYKIFSTVSTVDRLWEMYHCLREALEVLEREKVKGYEEFLNEKYLKNPVDQPMWKFHFVMNEYDNQKRNFFIRYKLTVQHAFYLIVQIHKALFLRNDFFESAEKVQKDFQEKAEKAKKGKAELTTEDFQNYHKYTVFSDEFSCIAVMDNIYDDKLDDDKSLVGYLLKRSFKRSIWLRHFLKVNNFLIERLDNPQEKSLKSIDKNDRKPFGVQNLLKIWIDRNNPPLYEYIGENEHKDHQCLSVNQILHLLLSKLSMISGNKMQAKDAIEYLEKESPNIKKKDTWLSFQSPERRLTTYVNDIRKCLPFSDRELGIKDSCVFLQAVRNK